MGYSDIESGCGRRREIKNKSEIVGLNNLKNGVDISYNWGAIFLFALVGGALKLLITFPKKLLKGLSFYFNSCYLSIPVCTYVCSPNHKVSFNKPFIPCYGKNMQAIKRW